jgi:hypothetical protein
MADQVMHVARDGLPSLARRELDFELLRLHGADDERRRDGVDGRQEHDDREHRHVIDAIRQQSTVAAATDSARDRRPVGRTGEAVGRERHDERNEAQRVARHRGDGERGAHDQRAERHHWIGLGGVSSPRRRRSCR